VAQVDQIPIVLLTGFLGSGKTTLLANWLKAQEFSGAMVIVNELGEVGIDHQLLATSADVPLLLDNGCACCTASEDLTGTLERLYMDRLQRKLPRFGWVLIETTGLADPLPILEAILNAPLVAERYRIAAVVATFDAVRGRERLAEFPEVRRQLEAASVVIITKTDIASAEAVAAARQLMPEAAPHAHVLNSAQGALSAAELLVAVPAAVHGAHTHHDSHDHGGSHGEHHHHNTDGPHTRTPAQHADGVTSAFWPVARPVEFVPLMGALNDALSGRRETLLRLKGLVRFAGMPGLYAVHAVPGEGITRNLVPEPPGAPPRTGFTIISKTEAATGVASTLAAALSARTAAQNVHREMGA
jgi:G3E family GTPase